MTSDSGQVKSLGSIAKQRKLFQMSHDGPFEISDIEIKLNIPLFQQAKLLNLSKWRMGY